jgi:hypothetical protein
MTPTGTTFLCRSCLGLGGALLVLLCTATPASSQYPYPPGYYPPSGPAFGPGGRGYGAGQYLQGSAQVMGAYGNLGLQQQQASLMQQQVQQAQLDTKKKTFDLMQYEKANTPPWSEEQEKIKATQLRRIMTQPTNAEITSGRAMNALLPQLRNLANQGIMGPPLMISPELLKDVNVTTTTRGGNFGMLRNGGKLDWPAATLGKTQKELDSLLPLAVSQAATGKVDPKLYVKITSDMDKLKEEMKTQFQKGELDGGTYLNGKRFMESLESAVEVFNQPNPQRFLDGTYSAQGKNMQELVTNMNNNGLQFAPATPGNESAYFGLFNSMVAYANGAMSHGGFQQRAAAPPQPGMPPQDFAVQPGPK